MAMEGTVVNGSWMQYNHLPHPSILVRGEREGESANQVGEGVRVHGGSRGSHNLVVGRG